jgi:hypothetical protein
LPVDNSGTSSIHQANPWLEYKEVRSYQLDTGLKPFYPLAAGAAPIFQQVYPPRMVLIQSGYSRQMAQNTTTLQPPPPPVANFGTVVYSDISPASSDGSTGTNKQLYTIHWTYKIVFAQAAPSTTSQYGMSYSNDPRRPMATGGSIAGSGNVPALLPGG